MVAPRSAELGGERARVLGRLDLLDGVIATVRGQLLMAERDAGSWRRPGVGSLEAARSAVSRSGHAVAGREVRQAEALAALPSVATAVGAGTMPVPHLDAVARVLSTASEHAVAVLGSPQGQETLVAMACDQDAPAFSRNVARWVASLDPAAHESDHQAQRRERFLHLSDQSGRHAHPRARRSDDRARAPAGAGGCGRDAQRGPLCRTGSSRRARRDRATSARHDRDRLRRGHPPARLAHRQRRDLGGVPCVTDRVVHDRACQCWKRWRTDGLRSCDAAGRDTRADLGGAPRALRLRDDSGRDGCGERADGHRSDRAALHRRPAARR